MAISKVILDNEVLIDLTDDTVTASKLLYGETATRSDGVEITGSITSKSAQTYTPSTTDQTIASGQYLSGAQTIEGDADLIAGNIKSGVSIFGITGTYEGSTTAIVESPLQNGGTEIILTGVDLSLDTVSANVLLSGYTAHDSTGTQITGSVAAKTASDITVSGDTVTVPAGAYASQTTKSVASGTAGTPSATKGTVSNNSVTVTPSVTNTAGYISGGTLAGTAVTVSASELVSGTKSISSNGTGIDVTNYADVTVNVQPSLQSKTGVSPTESSQTISADSGYDGLSSVQIDAISSTYVGSGIDQNDSDDLTVSGATVTVPPGYYSSSASKTIASGSATTPATTVTVTPTITVGSDGLITATNSGSESVTPTVSAGYISSGTTGTVTVSGSNTSQLSTLGATTYTPTTTDQTIASGKYLTGAQTIEGDANLVSANIVDGVTIFGITGSAVAPTSMTDQEIHSAVNTGWYGNQN